MNRNNSNYIKACLLNYFRFKRQMFVATEVSGNYGIADILATNRKRVYEVEIKTNLSDLIADFKQKKAKHKYMNDKNFIYKTKPNYFSFCFERDFYNDNKDKINDLIPGNYGIMIILSLGITIIIRKSKLLHAKYNDNIFFDIIKRNASEIANFYSNKFGG